MPSDSLAGNRQLNKRRVPTPIYTFTLGAKPNRALGMYSIFIQAFSNFRKFPDQDLENYKTKHSSDKARMYCMLV
jgi:hypothetical protein